MIDESAKRRLKNEVIIAIAPYVVSENVTDVSMKIDMLLQNYEIGEVEKSLIVYEGDKNELMLQRFILAKIAVGCSKNTVRFYQKSLLQIFGRIKKPFDEITSEDIRVYLAQRVQLDGVTKVTAQNESRCLSSFYTWLQNEEILLKNPMKKIESIKITKQRKTALTYMEIEKMRIACRSVRETFLIELLLSTWARVSEVANIKLSDIDDDKILVHGKGDKDRFVYLNAKAKVNLDRYLAERKDFNPYLFPRSKSITVMEKNGITKKDMANWYKCVENVDDFLPCDKGTIESLIRRIGKRAGVKNVHPHKFRRTGATNALQSGMSLLTVSKLLGHNSIATTQIYLDISDKELEGAHEKYVI